MDVRTHFVAILALLVACSIGRAQDSATGDRMNRATSAEDVNFIEQQIAPVLKPRCDDSHSHESGKAKGGLMLGSHYEWETGGSEGAAIVPGKPDESCEMRRHEQLPAAEIDLLDLPAHVALKDSTADLNIRKTTGSSFGLGSVRLLLSVSSSSLRRQESNAGGIQRPGFSPRAFAGTGTARE